MRKIILLLILSIFITTTSCNTDDHYSDWVESCIDQAPAFPYTIVETGEVRMARDINYNLLVGAPLPEFNAVTLKGEKVDLSTLKGKKSIINFWSMHCSPCLKEFKNFNKLVDKYKNKVNFLSFTSDEISEVDSLLKIHPFLFDIVPDARRITKDDFKSFWTYPFTIIVDEENRITHVLKGYKSSDSDDEQFVALDSLIKANL